MKLLEHEGKELFARYGIPVPRGELVRATTTKPSFGAPFMLKAQVPSSNRGIRGGVVKVERAEDFSAARDRLLATEFDGILPEVLLAEEVITASRELYVSFSYSTNTRTPVLALSKEGGTGVDEAEITPIDMLAGVSQALVNDALGQADIERSDTISRVVLALWKLFAEERLLLAEINPLFWREDGSVVAGDAKILQDDSIVDPAYRPFLDLPGDIAVLASGGGASLLNLDALMRHGGKPANYVEYSGNPPKEVVAELTQKVLSKPGLKGCWTIGGTANFTDIYETMTGFVEGLRMLTPKPTYPIVVRRDGPRQKEAFAMLKEVAEKEGFNLHLYGPETSMDESARIVVELSYQLGSKE
ncbi:MAG: ATP citrate lyase citrate-binding domain-containing protein [Candidatus Spechtbacterales bacterium]